MAGRIAPGCSAWPAPTPLDADARTVSAFIPASGDFEVVIGRVLHV